EAARARERLAEERRGEVPHRRRRVDVVEGVLRGDRERQAAPAAATLVPSFRSSASAAVTSATPEASTGAAASPAAATAPPFTASLTARRPGLPPAPQGNRLAEAQVDDDEAGTITEVPRDDGADGARVEQAVRGGHDAGRIGIGGEGGPVGEQAVAVEVAAHGDVVGPAGGGDDERADPHSPGAHDVPAEHEAHRNVEGGAAVLAGQVVRVC